MQRRSKYQIAIRREEFNKWERRVTLTPKNCKRLLFLLNGDLTIKVQPSESRVFSNKQFKEAGCIIDEDITDCDIILGVKQVPLKQLFPGKTYIFFSHVIKAQEDNMPMLDDILSKKIRLIDYEKIADKNGRLVAFGEYAGNAGMIDILSGLGSFLLNKGIGSPFINISQSYCYLNIDNAKNAIRIATACIETQGLSHQITPFIVGVTSMGRASKGARSILELLPHEYINPEEVEELCARAKENPENYNKSIFIVVFTQKHMVKRNNSEEPFDKSQYYKNPELYTNIFQKTYLHHLSLLVNCMYWDFKYPRIVTSKYVRDYVVKEKKELRLLGISDVTCDYMGSIEFLKHFTTIDNPFFIYNPEDDSISHDYKSAKSGILYNSIENMPTQFPFDASTHFGNKLLPFMVDIIKSNFNAPLAKQGLPVEIEDAVIAYDGKLADKFTYITKLRDHKQRFKDKKVEPADMLNVLNKGKEAFDVEFEGHLFDTKAINNILDYLIDEEKVFASIVDWKMGFGEKKPTNCRIRIIKNDRQEMILQKLQDKLKNMDIVMNVHGNPISIG